MLIKPEDFEFDYAIETYLGKIYIAGRKGKITVSTYPTFPQDVITERSYYDDNQRVNVITEIDSKRSIPELKKEKDCNHELYDNKRAECFDKTTYEMQPKNRIILHE